MRSMSNQKCKVRLVIMNLNSDEPSFYLYRILVSKYSGRCNSIDDPYAKLCVPDVVKTINIKVFNLMSRANETKHVCWHKICKCKCRLGASVCNDKQSCNNDICRCECKELINKGRCNNGAIRFVQPPDPGPKIRPSPYCPHVLLTFMAFCKIKVGFLIYFLISSANTEALK